MLLHPPALFIHPPPFSSIPSMHVSFSRAKCARGKNLSGGSRVQGMLFPGVPHEAVMQYRESWGSVRLWLDEDHAKPASCPFDKSRVPGRGAIITTAQPKDISCSGAPHIILGGFGYSFFFFFFFFLISSKNQILQAVVGDYKLRFLCGPNLLWTLATPLPTFKMLDHIHGNCLIPEAMVTNHATCRRSWIAKFYKVEADEDSLLRKWLHGPYSWVSLR